MVAWPWPGNIGELQNFVERAAVLTRGESLEAPLEELPPPLAEPPEPPAAGTRSLREVDREAILEALERQAGELAERAALRPCWASKAPHFTPKCAG